MGSTTIGTTLDGKKTKDEILKDFKRLSEESRRESGEEYSGGWNMLSGVKFPTDQVFESRDAAENYVYDKGEKYGPAYCVRFKGVKKTPISPPTFGGKPAERPADRATLRIDVDWKARTGYRQQQVFAVVPADQMTAEEKAKAEALYRAAKTADHDYRAASHRWPECGYANATLEQIRAKSDKATAAAEAWEAFRKPIADRIWATKDEPYVAWFLGGWAAE